MVKIYCVEYDKFGLFDDGYMNVTAKNVEEAVSKVAAREARRRRITKEESVRRILAVKLVASA